MSSLETDRDRVLLVERDGATRSRIVDVLSESTAVVTASTAAEARRRLADAAVSCLVLGSLPEDRRFLADVAAEHPSLPVIRFAPDPATPPVEAEVDARIHPSSPAALDRLADRVAILRERRRADRLASVARTLAANATDGVATLRADGHVVDVTDAFAETFEYEPRTLRDGHVETIYGAIPDGVDAVLAGEADRWRGTLIGRTPTGDPVEREHDVVRTGSDRVTCLVHPEPGPSERERVLEDHTILESMLRRLPLSLYVKDEDARHVRVSQDQVDPPIETPDGDVIAARADYLGKTDPELYASDLSEHSFADDRRVIETGEPVVEKTERYVTPAGDDRWTLTSKVPWTDDAGEVRGLIGATTDVTAEIEHEREKERQRQRLERFASMVAHDLRNPLSIARGYVELASATESIEPLADAEDSLDRMERLVEDVLAMARQGDEVLESTAVSLEAVLERAWEGVETGDATLRIEGDVSFLADPGRLSQLLENLLRNSIDHGPEDVTVTVAPLAEGVGFALEDDGPGIDSEDRPNVFESGYSTSAKGTGFGLAIVSEIVEAHGWEIGLSTGGDGGARFEISGLERPE